MPSTKSALAQTRLVESTLKLHAGPVVGVPLIPLESGENYRFHFDAGKCIGCKCCEVACHEQNNNPPDVKWRRVGEMEGGKFPETQHLFISMSCNHCLDPACMTGCPVDAYYKEEEKGFVLMKENACIGCQYCTWNCPYGAPQFNPERGMVSKCDMCHHRIEEGRAPACVEACPSQALIIEPFKVQTWQDQLSLANAPGLPDAAITVSTTRITLPEGKVAALSRIDRYRIQPEHPHYSLIFLTVLTQLAVGGFTCLFLLEWLSAQFGLSGVIESFVKSGHLAMLGTALLALGISVFHLGRPLHAARALKMWRRSWLSREVLFFTLFAGSAILYSIVGWQTLVRIPDVAHFVLGVFVAISGLAGVFCSAMIYKVPARPSWNSWRTPVAFFATAFILGPLLALVVLLWHVRIFAVALGSVESMLSPIGTFFSAVLLVAGFVQLSGIMIKLFNTFNREEPELQASARLLTQRFQRLFLSRLGMLLAALLMVPWTLFALSAESAAHLSRMAGLVTGHLFIAILSELAGRFLFFVTVVPRKRPEGYA